MTFWDGTYGLDELTQLNNPWVNNLGPQKKPTHDDVNSELSVRTVTIKHVIDT